MTPWSSRWRPWTWCRAWDGGRRCELRRGHVGRHLWFDGYSTPHWFDTPKEGTP